MPIYEYKCQDCSEVSEILVRSSKEQQIVCSSCGSKDVHKQFSVPGVIVKADSSTQGRTCCGRDEKCDSPPCSSGGGCRRDKGV